MKKFIALAASLMAFEAVTLPVLGYENRSLLVLGDSIASGCGLDGYTSGDNLSAEDSFANLLSDEYSSYDNEAVDGRTSAELLAALPEMNLSDADDIVISIGGNDFISTLEASAQLTLMSDPDIMEAFKSGDFDESLLEEKLTPETIKSAFDAAVNAVDIDKSVQNLNDIVEFIENENPESEIYILTVYNPFAGSDEYSEYTDSVNEMTEKYNEGVMNLSESYENVHAVDVYTAFLENEAAYTNISQMDIHPNKDGHKVIYELLKEQIDENTVTEQAAEEENIETQPNTVVTEEKVSSPDSDNSTKSVSTGNLSAKALIAVMAVSLAGVCFTNKRK